MTAKHTPGPWSLGDEDNQCCSVVIGEAHNLLCSFDRQDANTGKTVIERDEMLANAHLVIEAGTVAHETGMTPRQLAEQRAELLAALEMVRDADDDCRRDGLPTMPDAARAKIDAAISKATGSTS